MSTFLSLVLVAYLLLIGCTTLRVFVSTGNKSRAGELDSTELSREIDIERKGLHIDLDEEQKDELPAD